MVKIDVNFTLSNGHAHGPMVLLLPFGFPLHLESTVSNQGQQLNQLIGSTYRDLQTAEDIFHEKTFAGEMQL